MNWRVINVLEDIYQILDEQSALELEREYPLIWERVHAISCAQIGRVLAAQRGVNPDLAALACALHDIGRWYTGRQKDHARKGEEPLGRFLARLELTEKETKQIVQAVIHHSDKENVGTALEEIVKDADILDCYLHGDKIERPFHVARLRKLLKEIGMRDL